MTQAVMSPPSRRADQKADIVSTKRIVNVRLLVGTLIVGFIAIGLSFVWYNYRTKQVAQMFEQRAAALEKESHWREAAAYLGRYLQLSPDDLDARVRLVQAMEHSADSGPRRRQLIGVLYQTIGFLPGRYDLRLNLGNQLLECREFATAYTEAEKVLASKAKEDQRAAHRVMAISLRARARREGLVTIAQAAKALAEASDENPADVYLACSIAELYREYPKDSGVVDGESKADQIMDRLVKVNPQNPDALIARYNYRRRFQASVNSRQDTKARQDLDTILARDPDQVEALLLVSNEELVSGSETDQASAEKKLRKVIELKPEDPRGHIGLARLYANKNNSQKAADVLLQGRARLGAPSFEFDGLLAGLLTDLNRLDDAEKILTDFDSEFRRVLPELAIEARTRIENFFLLLRARLNIARNDLGKAIPDLNAVVTSAGQVDAKAGTNIRLQAYSILAGVMARLGRLDVAAAHWKLVADATPDYLDARLKAGQAYLELDRPAEAIAALDAYVHSQSTSVAPEAWLSLVQAHFQQQLSRKERNWIEFDAALAEAKKKLPHRWELVLFDVLHKQALGTDEGKQDALKQLENLEKTNPADSGMWERLVLIYQQFDRPSDAERALAQYDKLEPNITRRSLLKIALWARQGRTEEAAKLLLDASGKVESKARLQLLMARVKLLMATPQLDAAQQAVSDLIGASPNQREPLVLGLEIALMRQDYATAAGWEETLKGLKTGDDFDWRYFRARRQIGQFAKLDSQGHAELESLMQSLRSERPDWLPLLSLAGQYAELTHNRGLAIDTYRLAVDLGEKRPEIFERLIGALYDEGRYNEADVYLERLQVDPSTDSKVEALAIALAYKGNRLKTAIDLAKKAVDRGRNDAMHYVWLANLLSINGQQEEAERTYRESIKRFPKDSRVWNALFANMIRTKQPDRARRTLEKWAEQVADDDPAKHFMLAQGYESLGDVAAAEKEYGAAVAKDSRNVNVRMRLAKMLVSSDVAAARRQFEEVLKIDAKNADARHFMAVLLAASGNEEDWSQALKLLQSSEGVGGEETNADDRIRAILLARRSGKRDDRLKNSEAARRILTTRLAQSKAPTLDVDRMLLAAIYEQEADLSGDIALVQSARDALRPLVNRKNPSPYHLAQYIQLLLRHVERQQDLTSDMKSNAEQRLVLIDDAIVRTDELKAALEENATVERRFVPIAFRVRLLVAKGNRDEGLRLLTNFATTHLQASATDAERASLLLQFGNLATTIGCHQDAERWYRQLLVIAPNSYILLARSLVEQKKVKDAVEVCLQAAPKRPAAEVATLLTQLLSATGSDPELDKRVQPFIASALDKEGNNAELLMSLAVRNVTENKNDEAIKLFRRVLALRPKDTLALNNVATLLAEQPNQLDEARKYVEQAIAVDGRHSALLDTLGTIMVRGGENQQAVSTLEEAVSGSATDPRYYFHLAVAYQRLGNIPKAQEVLKTARERGLDRAILTSGDRGLLTSLNEQLFSTSRSK